MFKLKISATYHEPGQREVSDEFIKEAHSQSRWQPGVALIEHKKVNAERYRILGGYEYRVQGFEVDAETIQAFNPSEFFSWRDD